jgi:hypothetical protein
MLRSILGLAALILLLGGAGLARAGVILAQTDFGTTDGTSVSPFSTDYPAAPSMGLPADTYYAVAVNAAGHTWSYPDWAGLDHTNPGTGAFMVVNGSTHSSDRLLYYTTTTMAGFTYTWTGWVREIQSSAPLVDLSFQVNGVQQGTDFKPPEGSVNWVPFTFSYTASTSGTTTFSLNDLQTSSNFNDFGLDDQVLSTNASAATPEPASLTIWGIVIGCMAAYAWRRGKLVVV